MVTQEGGARREEIIKQYTKRVNSLDEALKGGDASQITKCVGELNQFRESLKQEHNANWLQQTRQRADTLLRTANFLEKENNMAESDSNKWRPGR